MSAFNDAEGVLEIGTHKLLAASPGGDEDEREDLEPVRIARQEPRCDRLILWEGHPSTGVASVEPLPLAPIFALTRVTSHTSNAGKRPHAAQQRPATGALAASEDPLLNIGPPPGDDDNLDVEARRIAGELVKLQGRRD